MLHMRSVPLWLEIPYQLARLAFRYWLEVITFLCGGYVFWLIWTAIQTAQHGGPLR